MSGEPRDVDRSVRPYACCRDAAELRCEQVGPDSFIEHCSCGRRHYVYEAEPVKLGVFGCEI